MTISRFSFLRRVRIHGGECGAVARALHHAVKSSTLYQADLEKASRSTIERKTMLNKSIFKRMSLVVASALGLSVMGTLPSAFAGDTSSFVVDRSSITVVTTAATYDSTTANGAIFKITLRETDGASSQALQSGETLTATVVGVPAGLATTAKSVGVNAADLQLDKVAPADDAETGGNPYSSGETRTAWTRTGSASTGYYAGETAYGETLTVGSRVNSYYLRVTPYTNSGANAVVDQGEYTIRLRLTSNNNAILVQDTLIKVAFVSTPIGQGFKLTATATGDFPVGDAHETQTTTKSLTASLKDKNDGRVVVENTAGTPTIPDLLTDVVDKDGDVISPASSVVEYDNGENEDASYSSSVTATNHSNYFNGTYGITFSAYAVDTATTNVSGGADKLRVRYADKSATAALSMINTASGTGTVSVSATGLSALSVAPNWDVPLTTKSVTVTVSGATAGNVVIFTPTWTTFATADVSHKSATAVSVYADSAGRASLTLTNANPVAGSTLTVAIAGFSTNPTSPVFTWRASAAATMSVSLDGAIVALASSNTFVATVLDAFGAPVSGVVLRPGISDTGAANYSATRTYATVTTDSNGQASYTLTDAAAAAADYDTVVFTHVATTAISSASSTITYATTAPAPTSLSAFYAESGTVASTVAAVAKAVPATGIYRSGTDAFDVVIARNNARQIDSTSADLLKLRIRGLEGAAVTATASSGAFILNAANIATTSRTLYGNSNGDVFFVVGSNKTGANTITFTSGAATASAAFWVENAVANARTVTLTGPTDLTANGELGNYTVSVVDRYGNAVSGANLSIQATGVAAFGGGATLQTFTTGASGEFTFTGTSFSAAGGAGAFTVNMTNSGTDAESTAGYVGSTPVESTVAAGVKSASVSVTFAAGQSAAAVAAEAASDAALEAIDAANAATDAANLAAEAADAATVAAEEARDAADAATAAVEALASEVATLMASLKAQLTTLSKTVAKIAKKVKA